MVSEPATTPKAGSAWLNLLHRMGVKTFQLDCSGPHPNVETIRAPLDHDTTLSWISNGDIQASQQPASNSIRLKLLLVDFNPPFWKGKRDPWAFLFQALDTLGMPHTAFTGEDVVRSCVYPPEIDWSSQIPTSRGILMQSVASNTTGLAWKYHAQSLTTVGILWCLNKEGRQEMKTILKRAVECQSFLFHPQLLGLLFLQESTVSMYRWVAKQVEWVKYAQLQSGFHQYRGFHTGLAAQEVDFGELSASVAGIAANIATSEICLHGLRNLASSIVQETTAFTARGNIVSNDMVSLANEYIQRQAKYWDRECQGLLLDTTSWQAKASVVMQGIFNLIAQRNQKLSIALAEESARLTFQSTRIADDSVVLARESKRDSTSMKAIAAVTMFFLPGTAVATVFAMPLFKWDATTGSVVNRQMWIYWAVTVPLTLLTFLVWRAWNWGSNRHYTRQQETLHNNRVKREKIILVRKESV